MEILYYGVDHSHNPGEFCIRETFNYYFISCFSTSFLYETDGRLLEGNAGDMLIMPPNTIIYHGPQNDDERFVNDWLYLKGEDFCELLSKYPLPINQAFSAGNALLFKNCLKQIKEELLYKRTGYPEIISACMTSFMIHLHRLYRRKQLFHSPTYRIEAAREAFLEHPEQLWSLEDMANLCDYSVSRFCALYSRHFGCSPKADLLAHRIDIAKQMLRYSESSITEIAEQCGFQSIYYFSKYFKAKEKCTPSEYAKQFAGHAHR